MTRPPETVVVTGASAGVGRAVAQAFGARGACVGLLARGRDGLDAAVRDVTAAGGGGLAVPTDVADPAAVDAAAAAVENAFGPIGIWVNAAMATIFAPFHEITPDEYRRATEVTYLGTVHGTMAALKRMRPRRRGAIVQVGSALSYRAIPLQSPYCGAKFAIRGFTDSLRTELMHEGLDITLSMVQLPAHNTPQFDWARNKMPRRPQPVPPIFQPEVAARGVLLAADTGRREIWVGMSAAKAILANKLVPGLLDHYLARKAYEAQMTDEPAEAGAPDNLFLPVPGDHGAHGRFDRRASGYSLELAASRYRTALLAGAGTLAALWLGRRALR